MQIEGRGKETRKTGRSKELNTKMRGKRNKERKIKNGNKRRRECKKIDRETFVMLNK